MTRKEHKQKHKELHLNLGLIVADFLLHNKKKNLTDTTILELIQWSYHQQTNPTENAR